MESEKRDFYFQFSENYINAKSNKIYSLVLEKENLKGWIDLEYSYNNEHIDHKKNIILVCTISQHLMSIF